jgi:hypothetical protein
MTTPNIVPRANDEGSIGTSLKKWAKGFFNALSINNVEILPNTTPTASSIPIADANGKIDSGWIKDASATVKGVVELATPAEVLAGTDTERAVTPATLTAKILGTVSQVGGVPTGAIIERGSNANGEYVKFADGTMMCHGQFSTNVSIAASINVWYESSLGTLSFNFPSTFINVPTVSCSGWLVAGVATGQTYVYARGQTYFECSLKSPLNIGSDKTKTFSYLAIGRWF